MKRYVSEFANDCVFHLHDEPREAETTQKINNIVFACSRNYITELEAVQAIINLYVGAFEPDGKTDALK